jgi:hypothetical protein
MPATYVYGHPPEVIGAPGQYADISLPEVMYYLYLPVFMASVPPSSNRNHMRLPPNVKCLAPLIYAAVCHEQLESRRWAYVYLSARKGWATPDNPLNRPGWHCDGFGSDDRNYVWWKGTGTRFAIQDFNSIASEDDVFSLAQFETQVKPSHVRTYAVGSLIGMDPGVVHATPLLKMPGEMRQYVKISFSNERYNLYNNSHNYLFDYEWKMVDRDLIRNNTHKAQKDFA